MNRPTTSIVSDQIVIDLRTCCSKDEAAAKLLGWLRGPIYHKFIDVTTSDIQKENIKTQNPSISIPYRNPRGDLPFQPEPNPEALKIPPDPMPYRIQVDQLKHLHSLEGTLGGSLEAQLLELHEAALLEFYEATEEPDLESKANAVEYWKQQIRQAAAYLRDIDDELANDDESKLKLDKKASKKAGEPQILLNSLDRWAKKKYKLSIFDDVIAVDIQNSVEEEETFSGDGTLKKPYADNLFTTMAFLIEAFSKTAQVYHSENGPVVIAIARKLEALAKEALGGIDVLPGQRKGAIKLRILEAMKRKKYALGKNRDG